MPNLFPTGGMLTARYHGDSSYLRGFRGWSVDVIDDHRIAAAQAAVFFGSVSVVPEL